MMDDSDNDASSADIGVAYTTNEQVPRTPASPSQGLHLSEIKLEAPGLGGKYPHSPSLASPAANNTPGGKPDYTQSATLLPPHHLSGAAFERYAMPMLPSQNRVFGLSRDLTTPSGDSVHLGLDRDRLHSSHRDRPTLSRLQSDHMGPTSPSVPSSTVQSPRLTSSASMSDLPIHPDPSFSALPATGPQFSVEVIAPSFDKRGYPIFSGRAARIRGMIRLRAVHGYEVLMKLGAHISQGTPAAIWDGIALMPPEQGHDHKVFTTYDIISLDQAGVSFPEEASPDSMDEAVYEVPFDVNLPLGMSTRIVDGEPKSVAVALPPSYELSSGLAQHERNAQRAVDSFKNSAASIRGSVSRMSTSSSMNSLGNNFKTGLRDAFEKSLGEVYRVGCFYSMTFTLQQTSQEAKNTAPATKRFGRKKAAKQAILDEITVPFIFLGEHSTQPSPPHSIPQRLIAPAITRPAAQLADGWEVETCSTKWSGGLFRSMRRGVELELHMPSPPTMQAPGLFPVLLILRPVDPRLLSGVTSDSRAFSPASDEQSDIIRPSTGQQARSSFSTRHMEPQETLEDCESSTADSQGRDSGFLSRFMRSSLTLSRKQSAEPSSSPGLDPNSASSVRQGGIGGSPTTRSGRESVSSTFSRSRPNTAPTSRTSDDTRSRSSGSTIMVGSDGQYFGNLAGLVRMSLIESTFCIASGPAATPKNIRRLVTMADVEEVDLESMFVSPTGETNLFPPEISVPALRKEVQAQLHEKGVRVLKGLFRIGSDATPSFRCHGIEVKYGIKVDLVPFSIKDAKRPASGGTDRESGLRSPSIAPSPSPSQASVFSQTIGSSTPTNSRSNPEASRTGGTSIITSDRVGSYHKIEKGMGSLFTHVRMVRGSLA